jgi:putative heme-binding domain-containing protein
LDVAWDNEVFFTQPTSGDLLNHVVVPEHVLARGKTANTASYRPVIRGRRSNPLIQSEHLAYVQIDLVGGFTAAAGCAIYDGGAWPAEWRYSYFTTEPTINIVHHEGVEPEGVTYTARKTRDAEFIGGRDLWYRPIETRVGPDGALYNIDFYNQAVIHNDTRGPRHNAVNAAVRPDRDHYFGRIWRVHHKQARTLDVPDLSRASMAELTGALNHPNQHVRMNAQRLLIERGGGEEFRGVEVLLADASQPPSARIHALWVLARAGTLSSDQLAAAARDGQPAVRKNAMQVAPLAGVDANEPETRRAVLEGLDDDSPQVRLQALTALGQFPADEDVARRVVSVYPMLEDSWSRSVVVGLAARAPVLHARMVLESDADADASRAMDQLAAELGRLVGERADADSVRQLILLAAGAPATKGTVKVELLRELTARLSDDVRLNWDEELETAMGGLLRSEDEAVAMVALPLIARWDRGGSLRSDVEALAGKLLPRLSAEDVPDGERTLIARTLLGVRQMDDRILPAMAEFLLAEEVSRDARVEVIEFMGTLQEQAVGGLLIEVFPRLPLQLQDAAFAQLVKRPEWALALVNSLEKGDVTLTTLGPGNVFRLRAHSDAAVASRGGSVIDGIRGPEVREKEAVVAQLEPAVSRPGNAERGRELYTQNCAVCHKFEGEGRDVGPDLTGMAAHGIHELLVHIIDPNRFVEENFVSVSIETRDGEIYDGMVARENRNVVTLRNASGEIEVRTSEIRNRSRTGMSLMPEGFEALGEEGLRDLLTYMGAGESRYRILDLKPAFTANSLRGIYRSAEADNETLSFRQFGVVMVDDIPFEIVHPARTANGNNVTVLKGGEGLAKTFPQTVTIPEVGLKAAQLHFLGGVGGWAFPCCGGNPNEGMPVARITVQYDDGESEELILKNGVEIVDYNSQEDVPGSKEAPGLVRRGQVRWFTKTLRHPGVIREITLSSYDNIVAPTFVAITVESGDAEE